MLVYGLLPSGEGTMVSMQQVENGQVVQKKSWQSEHTPDQFVWAIMMLEQSVFVVTYGEDKNTFHWVPRWLQA